MLKRVHSILSDEWRKTFYLFNGKYLIWLLIYLNATNCWKYFSFVLIVGLFKYFKIYVYIMPSFELIYRRREIKFIIFLTRETL